MLVLDIEDRNTMYVFASKGAPSCVYELKPLMT